MSLPAWLPTSSKRWLGAILLATTAGAVDLLVWGDDRRLVEWLPVWAVPATTLLACALLLARTKHPMPVLLAQAGYSMVNLAVPHLEPFACLLVALHAVAASCPPRTARLGLLTCAFPLGIFTFRFAQFAPGDDAPQLLGAGAAWALIAGIGWGLGRLAYRRERQADSERRRLAMEAERAVEAERLRLARDLHDSVAGAVTAMILHAAGAQAQLRPEEERVHEALRTVERAGTQAMNELHRMLGLLRAPDSGVTDSGTEVGGRPELAALDELVDQSRSGGLGVELTISGAARALDPSVDQAAYRVVQEALTNVTKHTGPGAQVGIDLVWDVAYLDISVCSSGGGPPQTVVRSSGYGLHGLRERVHLVGGSLQTGPTDGGGWLVRARLPVAGDSELMNGGQRRPGGAPPVTT